MITFTCGGCRRTLRVQDEHGGKSVRCPGCGQVAPVPAPAPATAPPPEATIDSGAPPPSCDRELTSFLAPAQSADELGRLGKYRIRAVLGRGGMGVVFEAHDSVLGRRVALKAILPSFGANDAIHRRFLREARALATLEHDHIVRLYEVNEDRGVPFIAMEFLQGEPLDRRLRRDGALPLAETLRIGREVAEALALAHERGVIHRDIKPANIWLEAPRGRAKVLDFGLARADSDESRLTQSGAVLGTPSFMAPEQARGEKVDFRCDLFSLGVLLYHASTGREPFTGPDHVSTLSAIMSADPPAPQVQNFDVPADLSDLIMRLLEKDPARRGGSARAAADALGRIERGEAAPAGPAASRPPPERAAAKPAARRRGPATWVIVAAAVAAVGCLGLSALAIAVAWLR